MYEPRFAPTKETHIRDANIWAAVIIALSLLIAVCALVAGVKSQEAVTYTTSIVGLAHST